jgi:transcriptional regulator GlxA family with amidase domain
MRHFIYLVLALHALCATALADSRTVKPRENYGPRITTMDQLMSMVPSPNVNARGVGILVYDGINAMDALGPYQVFRAASLKTFLVGKTKGTVTTSNKLVIQVDRSIDEVQELDVLVVPGGALETAQATLDPAILSWVRKIDQTSIYTTSVCTGAWVLGAAGLLQGKRATTHWYRAEHMLEKYGAKFVDQRWTRDGKYWTSAGVTAGLDMALGMVQQLYGTEYTQAVMLDLQYDPRPPVRGGTPEKSPPIVASLMEEMYDFFLSWFL